MSMNRRFIITEEERKSIRGQYFFEQSGSKSEEKRFCHKGNTKTLEEIVGDGEAEDYIEGVQLRKNGVNALTDVLELLKTARLHPKINDGGMDLASKLVNNLKTYNLNYLKSIQLNLNSLLSQ